MLDPLMGSVVDQNRAQTLNPMGSFLQALQGPGLVVKGLLEVPRFLDADRVRIDTYISSGSYVTIFGTPFLKPVFVFKFLNRRP